MRPDTNNSASADQLPDAAFCELTARKIEAHLLAGRWELAAGAFRAAHAEWQAELKQRREVLTRTPDQWLDRPICELGITYRNTNRLEESGGHTIRLAMELVNSGDFIGNFGEVAIAEFWRAIEAKKIRRPEYLPGGGKSQQGQPASEAGRKWNWGEKALLPNDGTNSQE